MQWLSVKDVVNLLSMAQCIDMGVYGRNGCHFFKKVL